MLDLSLTYTQSNDNTTIQFTDTTGVDTDGWDGVTNIAVTDLNGTTHTIELDIDITLPNGATTSYDAIDLYDEFGAFATTADLVFAITPALIKDSGTAIGEATDELPDGIYDITYIVDRGLGTETTVEYSLLIDGQVRTLIFNDLRELPIQYECKDDFRDCYKNPDILSALFNYSYLKGMEASAITAKREEILNMLTVLQSIY
jgi:hypothetical protein